MNIPRLRDDFEWYMLWAFKCGMTAGYGVNHEDLQNEELKAVKEFAEEHDFKRTSLTV